MTQDCDSQLLRRKFRSLFGRHLASFALENEVTIEKLKHELDSHGKLFHYSIRGGVKTFSHDTHVFTKSYLFLCRKMSMCLNSVRRVENDRGRRYERLVHSRLDLRWFA